MNKEELKELAATLNGIADGKAWEYLSTGDGDDFWTDPGSLDIGFCLFNCSGVRLKPWSLPPPPEGMQWHRDDWTEEMLPEGWRPLLEGESSQNGDQRSLYGVDWEYFGERAAPFNVPSASNEHMLLRTKRPLPQLDPYAELKAAHVSGKVIQCRINEFDTWDDSSPSWCQPPHCYRIKPEQQKVPLGPSDVPPGSAFTATDTLGYCCPVVVDEDGCYFASRDDGQDKIVSWEAMADGWQINRSLPLTGKWNSEAWEPCYKLIDTP